MMELLKLEDNQQLNQQYNRSCFLFNHRVYEDPIFDLPNLVELSRRLPDSYWSTEASDVTSGWGDVSSQLGLPETIETMAKSNSLVLLKGLAEDVEFAPLYNRVIREIEAFVGDRLRTDLIIGRATLIISSPWRITPYHIDGETNFLLQLRGEKIVNIFDANDRSLLPDEELEAFYAGDFSAAKFKAGREGDASTFEFKPGMGVHIPLHAPHWTQNGASVSVSLSVNCSLRSNVRTSQIYRFNHALRKRGITPQSPGVSEWQDRLKIAVATGVEKIRPRGTRAL